MAVILQLFEFVAKISLILTRCELGLGLCLVLTPGTIWCLSLLMGVLMGVAGHELSFIF